MRTTNILKYGSTASNLQPLFLMNYFSNVSFQSEDVIHAHFGWNGPKLAMLKEIGAIPDIPLVVSFYGSDLNVVPSQKPGIYDVLFRQADRCLGVSEFFADKLEKLGCPTEKITVHRLGVNGDYFNPDQNTDRRHNDQVKVLSIARLIECKGISFGIRAVAEALKQVPNLRYEIVGDGPRMDQLKQLVDELGVSNQIQFSGFVDRDTVKKKLATADVFLAPSVVSSTGSKEGTPTVIIEAMAMKLPVVTSDISGIPEMVDHGKTGYLEEPRDVDGIKKRLISLSENSEKRQKMSETARVKFNKQFDIKSLNKELIKIYKDVAINHG